MSHVRQSKPYTSVSSYSYHLPRFSCSFSLNHTATTEPYTLSLHDALPISIMVQCREQPDCLWIQHHNGDRKSTRLNSSHLGISYAVFCLKKKKQSTYQVADVALGVCQTGATDEEVTEVRTRECAQLLD